MAGIKIPRVTICGLRGGSGKTLVSIGLAIALRRRGLRVSPFKKGPDYIDAAWHSLAADSPCHNLDTFMMGPEQVLHSFLRNSRNGDISLVEGSRGVFDGMDADGTHSSAELAKLLKSPIVLTVDCTKSTRTVAAMVLGCKAFDPELYLAGVILNYVAGSRHEGLLRRTIQQHTGVTVLGALPRMPDPLISERHLGLLPPAEHTHAEQALGSAWRIVEDYIDLGAVRAIADEAEPLPHADSQIATVTAVSIERPRIGVIRDSAFTFYYPESLEQLQQQGADLVELNALSDARLPSLDGLYIGGGFPETHAARLSANEGFRRSIRQEVERGLPVYAECGGLTYLSEAIVVGDNAYPMVGVFPVTFEIASKPQGHGYTIMEVDQPNPFFEVGTVIRGHEFRYSRVVDCQPSMLKSAYRVKRGTGFDGDRDGLCYRNVLAAFCHIHPLGLTCWAATFAQRALQFRRASHGHESACDEVSGTETEARISMPESAILESRGRPSAKEEELIYENCLAAE